MMSMYTEAGDWREAGSFGSLETLLYLRLVREVQYNFLQVPCHFLTWTSSALIVGTRNV